MKATKPVRPRSSIFVPHGQFTFKADGQRLFGTATGPFNVELAQEIRQDVPAECRRLAAQGTFDYLCEFEGSALASPEALQSLGHTLAMLATEGIAPERSAYVFPPDLEGGSLLAPMFERAFAAAGMPLRIFATRAEALQWLDASPQD